MPDKQTIEIYIAMNEDGGYVAATDESEALEMLEGGYRARVVKLKVKMAPPEVNEAEIDIPDEAGKTEEVEIEAE